MARCRNLKPGFFKNEDLAECSAWARLCFAGLWTLADRAGRLEDRPKRIKGELFAFDTIEVEPLLGELARHGFIVRYSANGRALIQIEAFERHQHPHHREPASELPAPDHPGSIRVEPEALPPSHPPKASDEPEALPPSADIASPPSPSVQGGVSRADSGIRNTEYGTRTKRKAPPVPVDASVLIAAGFDPKTAAEFIAHKARMKAPLTQRAWDDHVRECIRAGPPWSPAFAAAKVMAKEWKGFESKYVERGQNGHQSFRERDAANATASYRRWTGQSDDQNVIEMETEHAPLIGRD